MANIYDNYIQRAKRRLIQTPGYLNARTISKNLGNVYNELQQNYDQRSRNLDLPESVARESMLKSTGQYAEQVANTYGEALAQDTQRRENIQGQIEQAQLQSDQAKQQEKDTKNSLKAKLIGNAVGTAVTAATAVASGGNIPMAAQFGSAAENIVTGTGAGMGMKYASPEQISQGIGEIASSIYSQAQTKKQTLMAQKYSQMYSNQDFVKNMSSTDALSMANIIDLPIPHEQKQEMLDNLYNSVLGKSKSIETVNPMTPSSEQPLDMTAIARRYGETEEEYQNRIRNAKMGAI
jgi:hypothetical protein